MILENWSRLQRGMFLLGAYPLSGLVSGERGQWVWSVHSLESGKVNTLAEGTTRNKRAAMEAAQTVLIPAWRQFRAVAA